MARKSIDKWQYGDFQTPRELAETIVQLLHNRLEFNPATVLEPSCGEGSFLLAAARKFSEAKRVIGYDINPHHVASARHLLRDAGLKPATQVLQADFFSIDWEPLLDVLPQPILILGNPPWVTSSELGMLSSSNLPDKSNFQNYRGIDAITGRSNFDISEWMLLKYVDWLTYIDGCMAVLCKTSVARKVLRKIWSAGSARFSGSIYAIDAKLHFDASVGACLFVLDSSQPSQECKVYRALSYPEADTIIGFRDGYMVNNVKNYDKWRNLKDQDARYLWRSGIKHDCSRVMELDKCDDVFLNGLDESVSLENEYVFPLLKSSDIGNGRASINRKYVLLTQTYVGEDTLRIRDCAPKTWAYLTSHKEVLDRRVSSIYKKKPSFSVFGVGSYTFSEWKVAISGFYKKLRFTLVGPLGGKPTIFDDTVYFLSFRSKQEAQYILALLNSRPAYEFLMSIIFWDEKRPITADILRRLSLKAVASAVGSLPQYMAWVGEDYLQIAGQLQLGIAEKLESYTLPSSLRPGAKIKE